MSDEELELQRVAGEITLVLEYGDPEDKESLLRVIEHLCGKAERDRIAELYE